MRVKNIAVKGLFGLFNHEIPLLSTERVTIIHGPNGFGKTVILKMITALIEGNISVFEHIPFEEFSFTLDDGSSRIISRSVTEAAQGRSQVSLQFFTENREGKRKAVSPTRTPEAPRKVLSKVDRKVPAPYRLSGSSWTDGNRAFSLAEIMEMFPQAKEELPKEYWPYIVFDFCRELQVFFVETNRLSFDAPRPPIPNYLLGYDREVQVPIPRVKHYSDDIVQRIRTVLTNYASHSQDRDRTFPERLVRFVREGYTKLPEREILGKMSELEEKRRRLISLGLLESERGLRDLTEEDVRRAQEALTIYVGDTEEKLKAFDDVARRIGVLIDIVNSRFKYKRLTVTREVGFRIITESKQLIGLDDLSSGEQHELVVLYELLFRGPNNGLILVDEPEISLHVAWQSRFLSDLIKILEPTDAYAIVATHSPVIIGSRSDLTVELKGPEVAVSVDHARVR
jgi:predicted ATP-dependent endonuclease of OLD family